MGDIRNHLGDEKGLKRACHRREEALTSSQKVPIPLIPTPQMTPHVRAHLVIGRCFASCIALVRRYHKGLRVQVELSHSLTVEVARSNP